MYFSSVSFHYTCYIKNRKKKKDISYISFIFIHFHSDFFFLLFLSIYSFEVHLKKILNSNLCDESRSYRASDSNWYVAHSKLAPCRNTLLIHFFILFDHSFAIPSADCGEATDPSTALVPETYSPLLQLLYIKMHIVLSFLWKKTKKNK